MFFPPHPSFRSSLPALALACVLFGAGDALAVIISFPDGTTNTTFPTFNGWDYVGEVNSATGTYLGDGWVITADHVGSGDFTLGGVVYPLIPGSEQSFDNGGGPTVPDLLMFQIGPYPPLPPLALRSTAPLLGEFTLMIGCGRDRGLEMTFDPNGPLPPDPIDGWDWLPTRSKRWGTNEIESFPPGLVLGTVSFATSFDEDEHAFEAQGADGDSGGAIFTVTGTPELAGILYAIGPANGQPADTSLYTNLTFSARIDFYYDQIQDVLALPEPAGGLPIGAALVAALARRRRRS